MGTQLPWITNLWQYNSYKYKFGLNTYHPLDKTKKLSQKKAKFNTLVKTGKQKKNKKKKQPTVAFKAGGKKPIIRLIYTGHSDIFN